MKRRFCGFLATVLIGLAACSKREIVKYSGPPAKSRVSRIEWKALQTRAEVSYQANGMLERLRYFRNSNFFNETVLTYRADDHLIELTVSALAEKQVFSYDGSGRLAQQDFVLKTGGTYHARKRLVYSYNTAGKLVQLDYLLINEAGSSLQQRSFYTYDNHGELRKIGTTDQKNNEYIMSIDSYSAPVKFNPMYMVFQEMNENYAIYNLAALDQMDKLPARIRRYRVIGRQLHPLKVATIDYRIDNGRLLQQMNTVVHIDPAAPVAELTVDYYY